MTRLGLTALIPTFGEDVVAIFEQAEDGNDTQILENAHIMRAAVDEHVTFFRHPLENGRTLIDHRIIEPVTIEFRVILVDNVSVLGGLTGGDFATTARDVYGQMRQIFLDGTLLRIQTRTHTYSNQVLQSMPHEETAKMFDGVAVTFNSSEILFDTANVAFDPTDPRDNDTVQRGKQNPIDLGTGAAANLALSVLDIFGG